MREEQIAHEKESILKNVSDELRQVAASQQELMGMVWEKVYKIHPPSPSNQKDTGSDSVNPYSFVTDVNVSISELNKVSASLHNLLAHLNELI